MTIKLYPVKIEAYDGTQDNPLFTIDTFDEYCASITISTIVSRHSWPEVSEAIQSALNMMFVEDAQ